MTSETKTVLVVHPNPQDLEWVVALQIEGFTVTTAENVAEAVASALVHHPDIVIVPAGITCGGLSFQETIRYMSEYMDYWMPIVVRGDVWKYRPREGLG